QIHLNTRHAAQVQWSQLSKQERTLRNQESQRKAAAARRGKPSWKAGLTKETDPRVALQAKKTSETRKKLFASGVLKSWQKGKIFVKQNNCLNCNKLFKVSTHPTAKNLFCSRPCVIIYKREQKLKKLNHKVIRIEKGTTQDVFDLTVDTYHNFALSCGVFVHNCADVLCIWAIDKSGQFQQSQTSTYTFPNPVMGVSRVTGRGIQTGLDPNKGKYL
ncbi:MAG: hypothetical protein ACREBJ_12135, partial [Nitrosotalea sp.]